MSRHPGTEHFIEMLKPNLNLPGNLRQIAVDSESFMYDILNFCGDGPELTAGLRKLLEAKDCFVRQALADSRESK